MAIVSNGRVKTHQARAALSPPGVMFTSLTEQLGNIRRWNDERHWGFRAADFHSVDLTPHAGNDPLVVDVVAIYLPDTAECNGVVQRQDGVRADQVRARVAGEALCRGVH